MKKLLLILSLLAISIPVQAVELTRRDKDYAYESCMAIGRGVGLDRAISTVDREIDYLTLNFFIYYKNQEGLDEKEAASLAVAKVSEILNIMAKTNRNCSIFRR